jgi:hypothetical protein
MNMDLNVINPPTGARQMARIGKGRDRQRGQIIVMMAGGMVAVILVVALIVDGGNAWAQRRIVQNASDAISQAGAIVLAQRFAGVTAPVGGWDAEVNAKVQASATANGIANVTAYYTDICGLVLKSDGSAALNPDGTEDLASAVQVGSGALPGGAATTPDCPTAQVGPVAGVMVIGAKNFKTYLTGVIGMNAMDATARATAVTGYLQGACDVAAGAACAILPVTVPVNIVSCDGSNNPVNTGVAWVLGPVYKVPLCQNGPGNVGWIDWTPPSGGTSELIGSITTPNNPAINLPSWNFVTETGNVNSAGVETALRAYDGQVVLIPQFDQTCGPHAGVIPNSSVPAINTPPNYGCPAGDLGGNGSNQWYRFPSFAYFEMCISTDSGCVAVGATHGAYVNGNNSSVCDTGNGATSCLVGRFVEILGSGTVGPGVGGGTTSTKAIGIQLIQ